MDLSYPDDPPFIVEILDINGKSQILDKMFQIEEKYQLTNILPGVYLVRLTSLDGKL